jgi:hypothetical protein
MAPRSQVSAFERLRDLPSFRGGDLTRRFGWTSKTASQYPYLWKRRGLAQRLGGHSDVYANLLASRHSDWEGAVVMAMPSAVLVGIEALRRALLHHGAGEHCGLSRDGIEWLQAASAGRDWRAARKAWTRNGAGKRRKRLISKHLRPQTLPANGE